jgi:quercetin dioxygenase-like cupin family protein
VETWDIRTLDVEPHKPQVLHSDEGARAIAINLPAGEELQEHQVHEGAFVIVADGELELSRDDETITGAAGSVTHFPPGERHTVRALSDARILLVLAPWPGEGHPSLR